MTRAGAYFWSFASLAWALCFVALHRLGTWTPFAFVGVVLAMSAVWGRIVPRSLLRPSLGRVAWGVAGGALMIAGTHLFYRVVVKLAPPIGGATRQLLTLLNVADFSPEVRVLLIVLIASCEEVLFRGLLPGVAGVSSRLPHVPTRGELARIVAFAVAYALTTLPLGSPLLALCALICGTLWGLMRVAAGSLVVPVLAHVLWDLGVLLLWPLPAVPPEARLPVSAAAAPSDRIKEDQRGHTAASQTAASLSPVGSPHLSRHRKDVHSMLRNSEIYWRRDLATFSSRCRNQAGQRLIEAKENPTCSS